MSPHCTQFFENAYYGIHRVKLLLLANELATFKYLTMFDVAVAAHFRNLLWDDIRLKMIYRCTHNYPWTAYILCVYLTYHKQMPFNLSLWNSGLNDCAAIYTNKDMFANKNVMICINIS